MKFRFLLSAIVGSLVAVQAYAQHSGDVVLGYDNLVTPTALEIEVVELTTEGILIFEGEFEELDPFNPGDFFADDPGFNTFAGGGFLVLPSDQIWLKALDASAVSSIGVGYVNYYNPITDMLEPLGRMAILDNTGSTADLILNATSIESGINPQFIDLGDGGGNIHDHVVFDLLDDATAPQGAYGLLFQLQSDFAPADGNMDVSSDPFWMVFNYGMTESDFETFALPKFGPSAPAPHSGDANGDGFLDNLDITAFGLALLQPAVYAATYPIVDPDIVLDMNNDGVFNNLDTAGFGSALGF